MPGRFITEWSLLQRRALRTSFGVCAAMVFGTLMVLVADDIADEAIFDRQLDYLARTLASTVVTETPFQFPDNGQQAMRVSSPRAAQDTLLYQIWQRDGTLLRHGGQSPSANPLVPLERRGFSTVKMQSQSYRVYALPNADGSALVQVAEPVNDQDHIRIVMLLTYLVSLLLPLWLTWRSTQQLMQRSMRLVSSLADRVQQQDPHDARPVCLDEPTPEIRTLLDSVNGLVQRAAGVISVEQRFTSVAAHELRAPLAGIRAQAQLAGRAESDQELQEALQSVMTGVDRASRVFDQLLDLTRMEGLCSEREAQFSPVDLQTACQQAQAELQSLMLRKRIRFTDATQSHTFAGVPFAIYLIVRNLLANAILYTPNQGRVEVSSTLEQDRLVLRVDDSGCGIAEADRQRVFERYCRLHQSSQEGIGLGLFIVQQAVQLHHGGIELMSSPYGGLRVQVSFAASPQPGA